MGTSVHWSGISTKFRQVHSGELQSWLDRFGAGKAPEWYRIVPRKPIGSVMIGSPRSMEETITGVELVIQEKRLYDRSGLAGREWTVSPSERSRSVIDEWECEHRGMTAADILWMPSLGNAPERDVAPS